MGSSRNNNDRRNLPSSSVSTSPGCRTRKYVDRDGYNVIETVTPTDKTVIRYSKTKNDITVIVNTESVYRSSYSDEYLRAVERQLQAYQRSIDYQMAKLDRDLFDLDAFLNDDNFFDSLNHYTSSSSSGQTRKSSSSGSSGQTRKSSSSGSSGWGLGCLFWSILILLALCLIIFGMGAIGKVIIDFLASLF